MLAGSIAVMASINIAGAPRSGSGGLVQPVRGRLKPSSIFNPLWRGWFEERVFRQPVKIRPLRFSSLLLAAPLEVTISAG